ncbi:MAG: type II toxin-antitoxin system prevent-host-death family antitoxin [Pseudomonadota bacterium]
MKTVNMHEAKTHLSKLVEAAVEGEPFVIAKAGKPLVRVEALSPDAPRRTGFLKGQIDIPDDFDRLGEDEIRALFEGRDEGLQSEDGTPPR